MPTEKMKLNRRAFLGALGALFGAAAGPKVPTIAATIAAARRSGRMARDAGFNWHRDGNVRTHIVGPQHSGLTTEIIRSYTPAQFKRTFRSSEVIPRGYQT